MIYSYLMYKYMYDAIQLVIELVAVALDNVGKISEVSVHFVVPLKKVYELKHLETSPNCLLSWL